MNNDQFQTVHSLQALLKLVIHQAKRHKNFLENGSFYLRVAVYKLSSSFRVI